MTDHKSANQRIATVTHAEQVGEGAIEIAARAAELARTAGKLRESVHDDDAGVHRRISDSDHRKAAELAGAVTHLERYIDARLAARIEPVERKLTAVHADTSTFASRPRVRAWVVLAGAFFGSGAGPFLAWLRAVLRPRFPWIP